MTRKGNRPAPMHLVAFRKVWLPVMALLRLAYRTSESLLLLDRVPLTFRQLTN